LGPYSRDGKENEQDDRYEEHRGQRDEGNKSMKELMEDRPKRFGRNGSSDNIIQMLTRDEHARNGI